MTQAEGVTSMAVKRITPRWLIVLALTGVATLWAFRNVRQWLVDPDALQHARAIKVLSGRVPFRASESANPYRQGWAPEVWLLRHEADGVDETLLKPVIYHIYDQNYDQMVLERLGVPKKGLRILGLPTTDNVLT